MTNLSVRERCERFERDRRSHQPIHKGDNRSKLFTALTCPPVENRRALQERQGCGHARDSKQVQRGSRRLHYDVACQAPERLVDSQKPGVQLAPEQLERVSGRQQELHAGINQKSKCYTPPDPENELNQLFRVRENIGKNHEHGCRKTNAGAYESER